MKITRILVLAVSLAANAMLAWRWFAPSATNVSDASPITGKSTATYSRAPSAPTGDQSRAAAAAAPANNAELCDRLRALGFPEDRVRAAVRAQVEARRFARQREWLAAAARQPWWRGGATPDFTAGQNRELRELRQAERGELLALFGPAGVASAADLERYAYLPSEKAARLATLESDYAEQRRDSAGSGAGSPGGPERLRQLAEEHDQALAALLTPEEQAMRAQRESQTSLNLADYFGFFSPSESEAQAIYALQRPFDDQFSSGRAFNAEAMKNQQAASEKLQQDLQAALGPERYTAWQRAQRPEYFSLIEMQRRFSVPQSAVDALAPLPDQTLQAAKRIDTDSTLTSDQKQAARAALVEQVRTQATAALGAELGSTYVSEVGRWWMVPLSSAASAATLGTMRLEAAPAAGSPKPAPPPKP